MVGVERRVEPLNERLELSSAGLKPRRLWLRFGRQRLLSNVLESAGNGSISDGGNGRGGMCLDGASVCVCPGLHGRIRSICCVCLGSVALTVTATATQTSVTSVITSSKARTGRSMFVCCGVRLPINATFLL